LQAGLEFQRLRRPDQDHHVPIALCFVEHDEVGDIFASPGTERDDLADALMRQVSTAIVKGWRRARWPVTLAG
jgi:hypothetical protein